MNTATATQRVQTTCVLGLALLISGTTGAVHIAQHTDGELYRQGHESFARDVPSCANNSVSRAIIFDHGARRIAPSCGATSGSVTVTPPPVRLARPLSDGQYIRSGDSIRYSF